MFAICLLFREMARTAVLDVFAGPPHTGTYSPSVQVRANKGCISGDVLSPHLLSYHRKFALSRDCSDRMVSFLFRVKSHVYWWARDGKSEFFQCAWSVVNYFVNCKTILESMGIEQKCFNVYIINSTKTTVFYNCIYLFFVCYFFLSFCLIH